MQITSDRLLHVALAMALLVLAGCTPGNKNTVMIRFIVTAPVWDEPSDTIYVSGSAPQLGDWNGRGLALTRGKSGEYSGSVELARGGRLEFKITRGSWDTVEKGEQGEEIANRMLTLDGDQTVRLNVARWRSPHDEPMAPSITGDVRYHENFNSKILGNERTVLVWLPPEYEKNQTMRYPVLYMHDGQNVFDASTSFAGEWRADETATKLIEEGRIRPVIIVAIENAGVDRVYEYTPTQQPIRSSSTMRAATQPTTRPLPMEGGGGEEYAQFLISEVKPFIDSTYRTLPDRANTAVCGSSLGGLISLHLGSKHTDVFGLIGAVSPSLWWDRKKILFSFEADNAWMKRTKVWFDMGTDEGSIVDPDENIRNTRYLSSIMHRAGLKEGSDFTYREFDKAGHDETAWAERFDQVLLFLFGK